MVSFVAVVVQIWVRTIIYCLAVRESWYFTPEKLNFLRKFALVPPSQKEDHIINLKGMLIKKNNLKALLSSINGLQLSDFVMLQ